jgi:hypothetical protein
VERNAVSDVYQSLENSTRFISCRSYVNNCCLFFEKLCFRYGIPSYHNGVCSIFVLSIKMDFKLFDRFITWFKTKMSVKIRCWMIKHFVFVFVFVLFCFRITISLVWRTLPPYQCLVNNFILLLFLGLYASVCLEQQVNKLCVICRSKVHNKSSLTSVCTMLVFDFSESYAFEMVYLITTHIIFLSLFSLCGSVQ